MYSYVAYGLGIRSAIQLPELVCGGDRIDVEIKFESLKLPAHDCAGYCYWASGNSLFIHWDQIGYLQIRDGREIIIDPVPSVDFAKVRVVILGAAMGTLLHQKGLLVLHSSAVAIKSGAALFVGNKGMGKSTTAASLYARGHQFLSDDIVPIDVGPEGELIAFPSYPQLKLWPEILRALGNDPDAFPKLATNFEKRFQTVEHRFDHEPVAVKTIFVLDSNQDTELEAIGFQERVIELLRNLYVARFGNELIGSGGGVHLAKCAALAQRVPMYRLKSPSLLGELQAKAELLEQHIISLTSDDLNSIDRPILRQLLSGSRS